MSRTTPESDAAARVLRTFVVIGFGTPPTASALPPGTARGVGPVARVADLLSAAAEARSRYVAIQRAPLPGSWLDDAAALFEQDPTIGAVVVVGRDISVETDVFAEAGPGIVVSNRLLEEIGGLHATTADSPGLGVEADLQWRLAARGYRIAPLPLAAAGSFPRRLPMATRLNVLTDNLEQDTLGRALPALVLATVTSPLRADAVATDALDLQRSPGNDDIGTLTVPATALHGAHQLVDFATGLPLVAAHRIQTQLTRRRSDRAMAAQIAPYLAATARQAGVTDEIAAAFPAPFDPVPTLRALVVAATDDRGRRVDTLTDDTRVVRQAEAAPADGDWADVILLAGVRLRAVPWVAHLAVPVVLDLSDDDLADVSTDTSGLVDGSPRIGFQAQLLLETLARADLVVVRDDEQRDIALGLLAGAGRLNDLVYDEDASLRSLVDTLDAAQLAAWCARPRRAVDLVTTYLAGDVGAPEAAGRVRQLTGTVRRAIGRGDS